MKNRKNSATPAFFMLAILLLFSLPAHAQAIANPSFEAAATGWTVTGYAGTFQPSTSLFASLPDGKTVAWSNGGTFSQDLGAPAQANVTYTLRVFVGYRADGHASPYTIALNAGATPLCTASGSNGDFAVGTFKQISLTCPAGATPPTGNLSIVLGGAGTQVDFDAISLTSAPSIPPQPDSVQIHGQLKWCAKCDGSDNIPATGNLLISQTGGGQESVPINPDGTVGSTATGALFTFDISLDPLEFVLSLTDANGAVQPGASLKLTFPRFELSSAGFTLGNVTLGIVRIAHTVDDAGNPAVRIVDVSAFSLAK